MKEPATRRGEGQARLVKGSTAGGTIAPAILQVGGGPWAEVYLKSAKKAGFFTVLTDRHPRPAGRLAADECVQVDGEDSEALVKVAQRVARNRELRWVNISGEFGIHALAAISALEVVTNLSPFSPEPFVNKELFRQASIRARLPQPKWEICSDLDQLLRATKERQCPFIIKPLLGGGHQGIQFVMSEEERDSVPRKISRMHSSIRTNSQERWIVEEAVLGEEFNIYGLMTDGEFVPLSVLRKTTEVRDRNPRWMASYVVTDDTRQIFRDVFQNVTILARQIGYRRGYLGCSAIVSRDKIFLLEAAPMLGLDHLLLADDFAEIAFPPIGEVSSRPAILGRQLQENRAIFLHENERAARRVLEEWEKSSGPGWLHTQVLPMPSASTPEVVHSSPRDGNSGVEVVIVAHARSQSLIDKLFGALQRSRDEIS